MENADPSPVTLRERSRINRGLPPLSAEDETLILQRMQEGRRADWDPYWAGPRGEYDPFTDVGNYDPFHDLGSRAYDPWRGKS